ncbi:MAG: hypothetical protein GY822_10040 [Deltaproteobacteria bacterium]|nr:hypothetical protein [Deltaproteobacteria bacterium]
MVLTASCCTKHTCGLETLASIARIPDVDTHILLGDTVYADGAYDLASYRSHWHRALSRLPYRNLRASVPLLCTWDDHEVKKQLRPRNHRNSSAGRGS